MITLRGCNAFYEGWLAGVFQRDPQPPTEIPHVEQQAWREGWDTATETGESPHLLRALRAEIARRHITVEPAASVGTEEP